jgi:predicted enzyme related to lactoylglutathione lyase
VIIAVADLPAARDRWCGAGFSLSAHGADRPDAVRLAAGAVAIDLCAPAADASGPCADAIRDAASRGGGIVGWVWGARGVAGGAGAVELPGSDDDGARGHVVARQLPGVFLAAVESGADFTARRAQLRESHGANPNTVDYLEHIVVMTPDLEDAIAAHESLGVPCKRIREVGNGMRQAFFKLEQTVIEVVGPARARPGCWGLAFMCRDIRQAVATARSLGLQATEPKAAVQGGLIGRIVEPLDGVAIAFMEAAQPAAN